MSNATHAQPITTEPQPAPAPPAVWSPADVTVIQRVRKDATAEGIDWRNAWESIGPAKIQSVVDELFPGPKKCGVSKALRIKKLIPVVPEAEAEGSVPVAPRSAPVQRKTAPAPAPKLLPEHSAPLRSEPEPEPEPEPSAPELQPEPERSAPELGTFRRLRDQLRNRFTPEPEPELPDAPEPRYSRLRRFAAGTGVIAVAVVAAMISYSHQKQLAGSHGQSEILAAAWPLAVDGLVLSCGILVAVDRMRGYKPRAWAFFGFWLGVLMSIGSNALAGDEGWLGRVISAFPAVALLIAVESLTTKPKRRSK